MKPWRPYWKTLERCIDVLLENVSDPPWGEVEKINTWISGLNYDALCFCDMEITLFVHAHDTRTEHLPKNSLMGGGLIDWQMVLRMMCALSFCKGEILKRKEFDWSQPPEAVWKYLLVELWRANGRHWAIRRMGHDYQADATRSAVIRLLEATRPGVAARN
jgi:hypothetical protein